MEQKAVIVILLLANIIVLVSGMFYVFAYFK